MKKTFLAVLGALTGLAMTVGTANADHIWINEFHYDNTGADVGEFLEIGIRNPNGSGLAAINYAVSLYNGSDQQLYTDDGTGSNTPGTDFFNLGTDFTASGPIAIAGSTDTITLYLLSNPALPSLQNGNDGIAITTADGSNIGTSGSPVVQFLSYEGGFTAIGGFANGVASTDLGAVVELSSQAITSSLGATGDGVGANQFNAASFAQTDVQTPGGVNTGQTFTANVVPEPGSLALLSLVGLVGLARRRR